jgi:hypothetical protein
MNSPEEIIKKIKSLQKKSIDELCKSVKNYSMGEIYFGFNYAADGLARSMDLKQEKLDMERKLKFDLVTKAEYDSWVSKQEKIDLMNKEIEEEKKQNKQTKQNESDLTFLAFHISYMNNINFNPNFITTFEISSALNWNKFNELTNKYKISNDKYVRIAIDNYNGIVESARRKQSINQIFMGLGMIILFIILVKSCS